MTQPRSRTVPYDQDQTTIGREVDQFGRPIEYDQYNNIIPYDHSGRKTVKGGVGQTRMARPEDNIPMSQTMPATNFAEVLRQRGPGGHAPVQSPAPQNPARPATPPADPYSMSTAGAFAQQPLTLGTGVTPQPLSTPPAIASAANPPQVAAAPADPYQHTGAGTTTINPDTGKTIMVTPTGQQSLAAAIPGYEAMNPQQRAAALHAHGSSGNVGEVTDNGRGSINPGIHAATVGTTQVAASAAHPNAGIVLDSMNQQQQSRFLDQYAVRTPNATNLGSTPIAGSVRSGAGGGGLTGRSINGQALPDIAVPKVGPAAPAQVAAAPAVAQPNAPLTGPQRTALAPTTHVAPELAARQLASGQARPNPGETADKMQYDVQPLVKTVPQPPAPLASQPNTPIQAGQVSITPPADPYQIKRKKPDESALAAY